MDNRKSGIKCSLSHCGKSRRDPNIRLFSFPSADSVMGQIWREKLNLEVNDSGKLRLCNVHFIDEYIGKQRLKSEAIPTLFLTPQDENPVEEDVNTFQTPPRKRHRWDSLSESGVCSSCIRNIQNCDFFKKKYSELNKKYMILKSRFNKCKKERYIINRNYKNLKKNNKSIRQATKLPFSKKIDCLDISDESKTLCKLIMRPKTKEYNDKEKIIAQNIFYVSQSSYKFMRNNLHINLPDVSTIYRWAPVKCLQPGFENNTTPHIKYKLESFNEVEKNVVVIFDEITIRRELRYNLHHDLIDGLEDIGFRRENAIGKQVCVFMVRGLVSSWKVVLNYFVTKKRY